MSSAAQAPSGPRIYNLFPLLAGPLPGWKTHLERARRTILLRSKLAARRRQRAKYRYGQPRRGLSLRRNQAARLWPAKADKSLTVR